MPKAALVIFAGTEGREGVGRVANALVTAKEFKETGDGFTIQLKQGAKRVTKLRAGTYRLVVSDRSPIHDFHLSGPGLNKVATGVSFVGTKTIKIKLKRGTYRYVCDPHRTL